MKTDKSILILHILSIVPALAFLIIYAEKSIFYISITILLILLLGINIYKYIKNIPLRYYTALFTLIGTFFLYAFYGLGSTQAPQTYETLKDGESVTLFNFPEPTYVDKFCYYVGINKNVHFTLESAKNSKWKKIYTYDESNFPYSFRWQCVDINVTTSRMLLRITRNEMQLNEVRFFNNNKLIPYTSNKNNLNDEPKPSIGTDYYSSMFFDEIYHGRTAYELLHNIYPVYENTHPYLGKLLLIPGIKAFGMTPFGWRFMNVLFASILIFVAYNFALRLFKERIFAFVAAFLMTYSFMHFTQARMAAIDTFGVLFIFISYFFLYRFIIKQKLSLLLLSGVFYGLASAVKWSAVFAALGFILIALYLLISKYPLQKRFSGYRLLLYGILSYGVVAILVYASTFYDIYLKTGSFQSIIDYQFNMYDYHSHIASTHSYSSNWWSWPLDIKPMCYYREIKDNLFSSITVFGNPAIFWFGITSILYLIFVMIKQRTLEASFILLAFLGLYLPYIFVGRLMFIYHFYYAVPFFILSIVYLWKDIVSYSPKLYKVLFVYLVLVSSLFLMFYPVISGYEIAKPYVDNYLIWFDSWWL